MFRIFIPGVGNVFVNAQNQQQAITAALRYLQHYNLSGRVNPADLDNLQAIEFSRGGLQPNYTIIDSAGNVTVSGDTAPGVAVQQQTENPNADVGDQPRGPTTTIAGSGGSIFPHPDVGALSGAGGGGGTPAGNGSNNSGGSVPAATTPAGAGPVVDPEDASVQGVFRNYLRSIGLDPESVLGGVAADQYQPLFGAFALNELVHAIGGANRTPGVGLEQDILSQAGGPQSFTDFLNQQGLRGASNTALGALQAIANQTPSDNSLQGLFLGATPTNTAGQILQNAALSALRTKLSPSVANLFGNQAIDLTNRRFQDQLASSAASGKAPPTFSQYLLSTLGLG